jgi:pyrroline-5-carboxylate reductase
MKIAFIGGGNMAGALIGGLIGAGAAPSDIDVVEIHADARARLHHKFGIKARSEPGAVLGDCAACVLAVKPQHLRDALAGARPFLREPLIVSIAAGIRASDIARWLGSDRIVRCMPNTPALIGEGITAMAALGGVSAADRALAQELLGAVGKVLWVEDESLLDPVTAVSGSGPAYVFYFLEAMVRAARQMGLDDAQGRELAVQTFLGAARLAASSDQTLEELRANVTSKGGTTAAAIDAMEAAGVGESIVRALHAAYARARAMADEFGKS